MAIKAHEIRLVHISQIRPNPRNRNKHPVDQIACLAKIIEANGFRTPLVVSNQSGLLVAGHGRLEAARTLGLHDLPVIYQDFDSEEQEFQHGIADNALQLWSELDLSGINTDIADLGPFDLDLLGLRNFTVDVADKNGERATMADKFMLPPFTVLNAREGWWQERKRYWLSLGIKSELGRGGCATGGSPEPLARLRAGQQSIMNNPGGGGEMTASFKSQTKLNAIMNQRSAPSRRTKKQ